MFNWNDLRFFLAVAHEGSTLAAARSLGVNQSTVQRRLAELEKQVGHRLVERLQAGYRLTELGQAVLPLAEAVAQANADFAQGLAALSRLKVGIVRLTCPEPIALRLQKAGFLDRFHLANPDLKIDFVLIDQYVDITRGDADVALRSGDTDDGVLVGRKIADSLWAVYASQTYVHLHGAPQSVAEMPAHPLIGFDESMARHRASVWLRQVAPDGHFAARNSSVLGLIYAAKAGVGVTALPMALGDAEPDLIRVLGPIPALTRAWRILAHPDQRHSRGVAAVFDFVAQETEVLRHILTG